MLLAQLKTLIVMYPAMSGAILIVAKIIGAVLFFPGAPLTLLAGAIFGAGLGVVVSLIGNTLGAIVAFIISRYFLRDYVARRILSKYPIIKEYEERFFTHGFKTVLFLRLIPLFPFNALNYLLGVTRVSVKDYCLGTALGIIPGTIAFVYAGESLAMLSIIRILVSIASIAALIYIGALYKPKRISGGL